jgi:PAT family beta-lactamase induction signal transducer AmpG
MITVQVEGEVSCWTRAMNFLDRSRQARDAKRSDRRIVDALDAVSVYLRRRVLIIMFLGFSGGLPLALLTSTLLVWMSESGVDLGTIGLFALIGAPYTVKFLWAPLVDALDLPVLSRLLGRRRAWLIFTQLVLIAAIIFLALTNPAATPWLAAFGALLVATASATQDIIIDAFRIETLEESEQAAGQASYVAAYRVGMLTSTAGALFLVSGFETLGLAKNDAWSACYITMAALVVVGMITTLIAIEPKKSSTAGDSHARHNALQRVIEAATGAFADFLTLDRAIIILAFVVLFKLTTALAGSMTAPFVIDLGFSRNEYATIINGVGTIATVGGGIVGGFIARAFPLNASLWIGGVLQGAGNLAFSWQALVGHDITWLTFDIVAVNFTAGIGTVIFVAYLSALCRNPLHTATQYALLEALAFAPRAYFSATAGYIAAHAGWASFFVICAVAVIPSLALLAALQRGGHFKMLAVKKE